MVDPHDDLYHVWNGFWELCGTRTYLPMGGMNPITFSEIEAYLSINGIYDSDSRYEFAICVRAMDVVFMTNEAENGKTRTSS